MSIRKNLKVNFVCVIWFVGLCIGLGFLNSFSKMLKKDINKDGNVDMWAYYDKNGI